MPTYKLIIYNPKDETTKDTLTAFASDWLHIRYKDKSDIGERLRKDQLLESDLFYLRRYLSDLFIMKKYRYGFTLA